MADQYSYSKKRHEFGRHAIFEDTETKIVGGWHREPKQVDFYVKRNPNKVTLDNIPKMSEHRVNTERIPTAEKKMLHVTGGWPKEFDYTETTDQIKYQKKLNREANLGYAAATNDLVKSTMKCFRENNQIDLFEEYFQGESPEYLAETISTKTVSIFKDPNPIKRAVTKITWHPDTSEQRVGCSYATLRFQQMPHDMAKSAYIWNLRNPNAPEKTLEPVSPLCTMMFNHKNNELIVGGSYNGSLAFFDQRKANASGVLKPTETTILEKSHHDPVYDVFWSHTSKTGTEVISTSTDGRILWWDMKKLGDGPIEELTLKDNIMIDGKPQPKILGATSLEYTSENALKYLVGTEQGYILQCAKRKDDVQITSRYGIEQGKHHGPVYALHRNPLHGKYFLSVGDWSAKIWYDDLKAPIMQTRYHDSYLTDGTWSPSRAGLFFLTRQDGFLDCWDFFYRQNEVAYSQKISDAPLNSIALSGSMAAVGDAEGTVHMISLCRTLYDATLQPKEKEMMQTIFEREYRREKQLEVNRRLEQQKKPQKEKPRDEAKIQQELKNTLDEIEEKFFQAVTDGDEETRAMLQQRAQNLNDGDDANTSSLKAVAGKTYQWKGQYSQGETQNKDSIFSFEVDQNGNLTHKPALDGFDSGSWNDDGKVKFKIQAAGGLVFEIEGSLRDDGDKLVLEGQNSDNVSYYYVCFK